MVIRLSTFLTPGAAQAARSASWRSAQDRPAPLRTTSLPFASTVIRLASTSALRPRPCGASEDDITTVRFHRDPAGLDLGAPPESFLDLLLDFARSGPRLETNRVDDALDAIDPPDRPLRLGALIIPLYLPLERDPSLVDDHLDVLAGERQSALNRSDGVTSDLRIRSLVCPG